MFSLRTFLKLGFLDAVGKMADYQIILNAAGWMDKGVLTQEDLAEIQLAIEAQHPPAAPEAAESAEPEESGDAAESGGGETESVSTP